MVAAAAHLLAASATSEIVAQSRSYLLATRAHLYRAPISAAAERREPDLLLNFAEIAQASVANLKRIAAVHIDHLPPCACHV